MKAENGRLIYDMPQLMQILPADDAYEALTRIPGVVDTGNGLTFAGRSITLIINGKPTTLDESQIIERLKSMPASMLAKSEIMTAAPAKYHVRGMAINIVTKDYVGTNQFSGQLQGTWYQSKYGKGIGKGTFLFNHDKFGMDVSYSFTEGSACGKVEHKANHPLGDTRIAYNDETRNKGTGISHNYRIGMDYAFSDNHRLNVAYTGQWTSTKGTNTATGSENSTQHSRLHDYLHNVDVSYQVPFGLQLNASYTNYQNPRTQRLDGEMHETIRNLTVSSRQKISKWLFTADQEHSIGNGWGLSYGAKAQFTNNNSFQTTLDSHQQVIADATSHVDYDERILNIYAGASKQIGQSISLDASIAAEQYHATLWDEWRIYPTLNAIWNINSNHLLNLSFGSNAVYPSYWSTMSNIYYSSAYSEIWGNPELKPSSKYDISMIWQLKRKYTFAAFACLRPDYFVQLAYQPSDRMAVIMKETNFNYSNYYGLQSSAMFSIGKWLNGNVNLTGLYTHDKSDHFFDLPFNRHNITAVVTANVSAKLSTRHNIVLMLNPFFQTKGVQGVYDIAPLFTLNATLRWTSANGKWSIIAKGDNIFNNSANTHSYVGNQDYSMRVWMQYVGGSLSAVYRIGGFKEKKTKAVDTSRMGY
ncbi:MAG: TonB-dependent receptor family protein [Prevotella sp.]|nr:TonB-dependent receptor family protein [Prevotella sp.]